MSMWVDFIRIEIRKRWDTESAGGLAHAITFLGVFMSIGVLDHQIHQRIFDLYQGISPIQHLLCILMLNSVGQSTSQR